MVTSRLPFNKGAALKLENGTDTWRLLAYVLIGVLSALVLTVVVSLFVSWHCIRKKKAAINRNYEGEGEYVVICRLPDLVSHPPPTENIPRSPPVSPQRRSSRRSRFYRSRRIYRPQRRLMNEYVDDVFESEDSGGSRSVRIPLHTIPEDN
uniref:Uncharacterized protein LOC111119653 n=1 Tax=Crassostrea virginica TaxID=6565 RepID=A0A8B8CIV9_CRAVI|nr:uncharacterized protein LOC111119653 [Crassostrea virginica]